MVQVCTSSPWILHLIGTIKTKNRSISYMCHHQGRQTAWSFILQVSELSLLQVCLFQRQWDYCCKIQHTHTEECFACDIGGALVFGHTFWGSSQYVDVPVPCGGSKVVLIIIAVLIHIHPHYLACYTYWKLRLVLICVHCECYCVSF
jgi:hypothetical protein